MAEISPLRRRMIEDMTVRNLSPATQRSYLAAVSKLSRYFGRSPDCLELDLAATLPGRPVELHHQPPTEPCISLSTYTARPSYPVPAHADKVRTEPAVPPDLSVDSSPCSS
jgi:hypothetical protein